MYHYKANAILAKPISGLDDISIFNTYKMQFEDLTSKGFKPKINIMDNQVTKHIKAFLTEQQCKLQLVDPHNHRMNAAERAIQIFKNAFIAALATTDSDFPLQLRDKITPQVQDTLNLMQASLINPAISAYKALNNRMIKNDILLPRWDAERLSTKMATPEDHGHCKVLAVGTWAHQLTTTDVTFTTFLRLTHIKSWVPQNFSHNTAKCQTRPCTNTFAQTQTSWQN
jgi:hypothetical protein